MRIWQKLTLILLTAMLGACAIAPGMTMSEPAEIPDGPTVRVTPITLDLLDELAAAKVSEIQEFAQEFAAESSDYVVGAGDVLQIIVWDHPELTIPAGGFRDAEQSGQQVGYDGYLYYPYAGMVRASGRTVSELRLLLTEKLSSYIQDPQLDIRVIAYRSKRVYIVGEVSSPGVLPVNDIPLTIVDAISLSGGLAGGAHKGGVNISRDGKVYKIDLKALYDHADFSQNLALQHGDIVNVLDRSQQKVFMMGEVRRPSPVGIVNGYLTLAAALGEVGGLSQNSASGAIYVLRGSDGSEPQIFHLDVRYATGMLLAERFDLQAKDVIFADTAGISQWNRVLSQLLPSVRFIGTAENLVTN